MRNKLLFVVPPCVAISELIPNEKKTFSSKIRKEIPLGVLSLATYTEYYAQVDVTILDLNLKFYELVNENKINKINTPEKYIEDFVRQLQDQDYDFCGISAIFSPTFSYIRIISQIVKEVFPKAVVVTGGGVPSNLMQEVFDSAPCIDIISYGEGEIGISGLVSSENEKRFLQESPSLITREKLENGFCCSFEFIEDLDKIPPLDFSLIDFEKYSSHAHSQIAKQVIAMPLMFSVGALSIVVFVLLTVYMERR